MFHVTLFSSVPLFFSYHSSSSFFFFIILLFCVPSTQHCRNTLCDLVTIYHYKRRFGLVDRVLGFDARGHWFDPGLSLPPSRAISEVWCLGDFRVVRTRSIAGGRLLSENSRNWKVLRNLCEFLGKFPEGCAECPRVSCRRSMIHASGGC